MGVVYHARHLKLNRRAAIKMILGGKYHAPAARVRFLIEAEAVAALDHPNIVGVYEFGTHDGQPFFALEYVAGGTLADRLKRDGKSTPRSAAELMVEMAEAIAAAHAKGIVHRDLKPGNVLLTEAGEPKVTDFGLAKVGGSDLTATGAVMGTPSYMAPEQAGGKTKQVGTHTDVYALGAILYEMLTARPPFKGDSVAVTLQQVLTREPERPRATDPAIPRDLETICLKCLEKEPARRYPTAEALAADLRAYLEDRPIAARPVGRAERAWKWVRRNPGVSAAVGAAVVALVAGSAVAVAFGIEARSEADRANGEAARANDEAARANDEAVRAMAAEKDARQKKTEAEAEAKESRRRLDLNRLQAAQAAFDNNLVQLARDTLDEIAPENRCIAWGLLNRRFEGSLFTLYGHTDEVSAVAVSADGTRVVTGSWDKTARVWDAD
jgi:tRNA A-37 threonylcarbamoyl transferase component Bud32